MTTPTPTPQPDSTPTPDPVVEANVRALRERSHVGIAKYGVMLDRTDLSLRDWLQHALEETLDKANYLQAAIRKLDADAKAGERACTCIPGECHGQAIPDFCRASRA